MPPRTRVPPFRSAFSAAGIISPAGAKHDGRIELNRWLRKGAAGPFCAEFECEFLVPRVAGGCVHFHVPVQGHLDGNVGGSAKSVEAQLAAWLDLGEAERAKPDDPGAEQRGCLLVRKLLGDGVDKVFWCNSILRVAAVHGIASEGGVVTKIFRARAAEFAGAVGVMQPGDPYSCADGKPPSSRAEFLDHANDLVSRDYRRFLRNQFPFNDMQVGPADAAV